MFDITAMIAEATSEANDGIAREYYRAQLLAIRDRINRALGETYCCVRCGRELVVPQYLDYVDTDKGRLCGICVESATSVSRKE